MQREIKFRAWDKENNEMLIQGIYKNRFDIHFYLDNSIGISNLDYENFLDFELMQYTGLKDKNGVEIYEGDIVSDKRVVVYDTLFVRFGIANYDLNARPNWVVSMRITPDSEIEVIGNIYQHKELLK